MGSPLTLAQLDQGVPWQGRALPVREIPLLQPGAEQTETALDPGIGHLPGVGPYGPRPDLDVGLWVRVRIRLHEGNQSQTQPHDGGAGPW